MWENSHRYGTWPIVLLDEKINMILPIKPYGKWPLLIWIKNFYHDFTYETQRIRDLLLDMLPSLAWVFTFRPSLPGYPPVDLDICSASKKCRSSWSHGNCKKNWAWFTWRLEKFGQKCRLCLRVVSGGVLPWAGFKMPEKLGSGYIHT